MYRKMHRCLHNNQQYMGNINIMGKPASIGSEATFVAMLGSVVSARTPIGTRDDIFNAS